MGLNSPILVCDGSRSEASNLVGGRLDPEGQASAICMQSLRRFWKGGPYLGKRRSLRTVRASVRRRARPVYLQVVGRPPGNGRPQVKQPCGAHALCKQSVKPLGRKRFQSPRALVRDLPRAFGPGVLRTPPSSNCCGHSRRRRPIAKRLRLRCTVEGCQRTTILSVVKIHDL